MAKSLGHVVSLCGHILAEISADFFYLWLQFLVVWQSVVVY